jgi:hypothetical protein
VPPVITASNEIVTPSVSAFINLPDNVCYLNDKGIVIWIQLSAVTATSIPQSYQIKQEEVLEESKEMADSRAWLEKYTHEAKEKNID